MLCSVKRFLTVFLAVVMVLAEPLLAAGASGALGGSGNRLLEKLYSGRGTAYASVGSVAEGEDIIYDKTGGMLSKLGFDTTQMPETYDPDATTNPYGSDVSIMNEVDEIVTMYTDEISRQSYLYGHNKKLDGQYSTFTDSPIRKDFINPNDPTFINTNAFLASVKCDVTGDGRDNALALVYTNYNIDTADRKANKNIYLRLYDPVNGVLSDAVLVAQLKNDTMIFDYVLQSQMQITAGDYDKDSVDEIAVYTPSGTEKARNRVTVFDLIDGKECEDPFSIHSWKEAWNYVLPLSDSEIVNYSEGETAQCAKNIYNNIDLTSGDADNDGISDLVISYGASETDVRMTGNKRGEQTTIRRSIPSTSVILYGSDTGQMLREAQTLSYGDNALIRVSTAFGDIDGDGNEDLFLGGQLQSEQSKNESRVLGRYIYDEDAGGMDLESIQNMKVVDGGEQDGKFYSSNGWDEGYYSAPLMKANIAIGRFMGEQSDTKIYLDSVLYAYSDGEYEIVDELEDESKITDDQGQPTDKYKGSRAFTDIRQEREGYGTNHEPCWYFEYAADAGNFSGSFEDYLVTARISIDKQAGPSEGHYYDLTENRLSLLRMDDDKKNIIKEDIGWGDDYRSKHIGSRFFYSRIDTDIDSMVATYTGEHNIVYQEPRVLAVLTSAPYFKDVADYTGGSLLSGCSTTYGETEGSTAGENNVFNSNIGVFANVNLGMKVFYLTTKNTFGVARSSSWGYSESTSFKMSYKTGGEDSVVMYSIPTENYTYIVEGVSVDDDGNLERYTQPIVVARSHNPVTQTLSLDDYKEIQKTTSDIPDVTKYFSSTPGDPSSYPRSENDLSKDAKDNLLSKKVFKQWAGVAYGSGNVTQTITYNKSESKSHDNILKGSYKTINFGVGTNLGGKLPTDFFFSGETGLNYSATSLSGSTASSQTGNDCSGTVPNMPKAAKGYGYDFSWKLFKYEIKQGDSSFYVITYIVDDVSAPPKLPDSIQQDFDNTTDSQIALTWAYSHDDPKEFDVYRYEDFPQGGGDKLVGTVDGRDYRIMKDDDGNSLRDDRGRLIRQYSFADTGLTADSKYNYRLKVKQNKIPPESIFSPVVEARTDVSTKPDVSLSTDSLTIYPDDVYEVKVKIADKDQYQKDINYQWQKYNQKTRQWEDVESGDKAVLMFFNCTHDNAGEYRCRVNLIRKVEGNPQYISSYTETCKVKFALRTVEFGDISVFEGEGSSAVNTGVKVSVKNSCKASTEKPTGKILFTIKGPNGTIQFRSTIDEATGVAGVSSIEDLIGTIGQKSLVDGGYLITARYEGSAIFDPADCPEAYHYLRNIDECIFLSTQSAYYFGDDISKTLELSDYKKDKVGKVSKTDLTDKLREIRFYPADENGEKTGDAVAFWKSDDEHFDERILLPLNKQLAKKAYIEAYMEDVDDPVASSVVDTMKVEVELDIREKMTGTGNRLNFIDTDDIKLSNGIDPNEKNIETGNGDKSLADFMVFNYYEQNGEFVCDSTHAEDHRDDFIPAKYYVTVSLTGSDVGYFYKPSYKGAGFTVVGNYYLVSAGPKDPVTGSVTMISPDDCTDFSDRGYAGGTKITLKAIPNTGYEIKNWIIDECGERQFTLPGNEKIDYTVKSQDTDGTGKIDIKAVIRPKDNTLKYDVIGGGDVAVKPVFSSGSTVLADTKLTFTATPDDGWHFDEWRWTNVGGNNMVSGGITGEDGTNTKTFRMADNPVELYAVFAKNTIDILCSNDMDVLYLNDGSNPDYGIGEMVKAEKGSNVPKGATVTVTTKPGVVLAPGSEWTVAATNAEGIVQVPVEEIMYQGREACRFTVPNDAETCAVSADTNKGHFSVNASGEGIAFEISVDGTVISGNKVDDILAGSQVDIKAKPARGRKITEWVVNGVRQTVSDTTYSFNITDNMNVSVSAADDEEHKMTLSTEGGGTGKYVITDKNGDTVTGTFTGDPQDVTTYKGESVFFDIADDDTEHTLISVVMDGEKQDLNDGTFTLSEVTKDTDIVVKFGQNTYCDIEFDIDLRNSRSKVYDEDSVEIHDGEIISVTRGSDYEFSLLAPSGNKYNVRAGGIEMEPVDTKDQGDMKRYYFKVTDLLVPAVIKIDDHDTEYIRTAEELKQYFNDLKATSGATNQPDGVLTADIDMTGVTGFDLPDKMYAEFDGQGYDIKGITIGSEDSRLDGFIGLFGDIAENGAVKNVIFRDTVIYAENTGYVGAVGVIACINNGTISGVSQYNTYFDMSVEKAELLAGGIVYSNNNVIEGCLIDGITIATNKSSYGFPSHVTAGALYNRGQNANMLGCYFEDYKIKNPDTQEQAVPATTDIISYDNDYYPQTGVFKGNVYKAGFDVTVQFGTRIYDITETPSDQQKAEAEIATAEFSRKLAYTMNKSSGEQLWGAMVSGDPGFCQISLDDEVYDAPIRIDYVSDSTITRYYIPGDVVLPGEELFHEHTPDAWVIGEKAYKPGVELVIKDDTVVTGIVGYDDFVAARSDVSDTGELSGTEYYKNIDTALKDTSTAAAEGKKQDLQIIGNCTIGTDTAAIEEGTAVTVNNGKALTINKDTQVNNSGSITVVKGAIVYKYGSLFNRGDVSIAQDSFFYNYGSAFDDKGNVTGREYIICSPHLFGEWKYADKPDAEGKWTKTAECEVCGSNETLEVDVDPPAPEVEKIEILCEPDKTTFEAGSAFSDKGLFVTALLANGTRAAVKSYTLSLRNGDEERELRNGDILENVGSYEVIVTYGKAKAGFEINVINTADLLTITDKNGKEIDKADMQAGDDLELNASLKSPMPYRTSFKWESSDVSIAGLDSYDPGNKKTVTAREPGVAVIKVTVIDSNGQPVEAIRPKTVTITNVSHVTEIKMKGGDIRIDKGASHHILVDVIPENTTDKISWTSSNEDVATVDGNGVVTGTGGGKAVITVSAPNGISDSRKVSVYEKAKSLELDPEDLAVRTGGYGVITAKVENYNANGEVTWTVDESAAAAFYVRNEKTGEMEPATTVKTPLSGDGTETSDAYVVIAGLKEGTADVKAAVETETGDIVEKVCRVTVADAEDFVTITHNGASASGEIMTLSLVGGRYIQLGARSSKGDSDSFTWSSVDDGVDPVIKVDSNGGVTLKRKGTAVVKVTSDLTGATDIMMVRVVIDPTGVKLSKDELKLLKGESYKMSAVLEPEDAEGSITWTSSDENVATVSADGEIKAIGAGSAVITAAPDAYGAEPATCTVTVYEPKLTVTLSRTSYTYDGKKHKPAITVKNGSTVLATNITGSTDDLVVLYYNDKSMLPGIYKVAVIAREWYYGSGEAEYTIKVKPTKIKKIKKGHRKITVKWKKVASKNIKGYQVRISRKKNMKKASIKTIKSWKKTKVTIKKLKAKKKYYVQVRTYYKKNGIMYYSSWSAKKKVKVKK